MNREMRIPKPGLAAPVLLAAACAFGQQPSVPAAAGRTAQAPAPVPADVVVSVQRDIPYGSTPEKELLLDLYTPAGRGEAAWPAVVWIHGGAWRQGSKDSATQAMGLVHRGYAVASISYRLSQEARFPAQIHDAKAAVRWLRARASRYGIDPERIGVWGPSAGGHLAALLGTSGGVEELEGGVGPFPGVSSRVQAVVNYFGPTDFLQMDAHSISGRIVHDAPDSPESQLIGAPIRERPDLAARANPITYVSPGDPPFLIVHGDEDPLVPLHQSQILHEALERAGVESELYAVVGGGHGSGGEFGTAELFERVAAFFDKHLK